MIYTGIGSRETPLFFIAWMIQMAKHLREHYNAHCYSGCAPGADSAFELGARAQGTYFIPYAKAFNRHERHGHPVLGTIPNTSYYIPTKGVVFDKATEIIRQHYHGYKPFDALKFAAQGLHRRNVYQILGPDLAKPTQFVICYTPDGATCLNEFTPKSGGTRTAIRIAELHNIPVFNIQRDAHRVTLEQRFDVPSNFHAMVATTEQWLLQHKDAYETLFPHVYASQAKPNIQQESLEF